MELKEGEELSKEGEEESAAPAQTTKYVLPPEAPDGGYGWVIVCICFMIHVIVDGAAFGYGVLSNHIKEYYGATESQATLVGSLQLGFYLLSCKS
jgi:Na+-transporting NADH:ubiquinone oxidoreductase subunit NqrD